MDSFNLSNPILLIVSGFGLLALLYFWNKHNTKKRRTRNRKSFRKNYYDKKKDNPS
tara:strand:+ start:2611 stop:2778 length:168 start_codon:yes stop_codon:yes gene_type:complete